MCQMLGPGNMQGFFMFEKWWKSAHQRYKSRACLRSALRRCIEIHEVHLCSDRIINGLGCGPGDESVSHRKTLDYLSVSHPDLQLLADLHSNQSLAGDQLQSNMSHYYH